MCSIAIFNYIIGGVLFILAIVLVSALSVAILFGIADGIQWLVPKIKNLLIRHNIIYDYANDQLAPSGFNKQQLREYKREIRKKHHPRLTYIFYFDWVPTSIRKIAWILIGPFYRVGKQILSFMCEYFWAFIMLIVMAFISIPVTNNFYNGPIEAACEETCKTNGLNFTYSYIRDKETDSIECSCVDPAIYHKITIPCDM
jgi:hypothetical protein